jgi:protein-L-isoaspartate(D-aspartate) O-methyltransferase
MNISKGSGTVFSLARLSLFSLMILFLAGDCNAQNMRNGDYQAQRERMVRTQIRSRGISDRKVLDAMLKVPRHLFVPEAYRDQAYGDFPLPIGEGQTISQPYIVAIMTEVLELDALDKVLEIGTGSGYQAAVLGEICDSVFTIELYESLGRHAGRLLEELEYDNVFVKVGDGYEGWEEHSPFDAIIVTCAPRNVPGPLKDQLREGGKMVIPVGELYAQELLLLTKEEGELHQKYLIPVRFVPMKSQEGRKY